MRAPLVLLLAAAPAAAAPLVLSHASRVVADGTGGAGAKAVPGAQVDYTVLVTNPAANLGGAGAVVVTDELPATVKLRVADLAAAGGGPVEFVDGDLLGLGLLGSGLQFAFRGLDRADDSVDFSDGASWSYVPVPDADGCDPRVRRIRVRPGGIQAAGSGFRLRFRVVVR